MLCDLARVIASCFGVIVFAISTASGVEPTATRFTDVEITPPFDKYLTANPLLMDVAGAKIIKLSASRRVVLAVASTPIKDDSAKDRLRAERVCRAKALAAIVAEKNGIQVAHTETVDERTTVVLEDGRETATSVSELLQVTRTKVEGITHDMPVVGRWKSKDGNVYYLAIGAIVDRAGTIVED